MTFRNPQYLVETSWLQEHLGDPDLRVLDCTVFLRPTADGGVRAEPGRSQWEQAHIPGAQFVDLVEELSDRNTPLPIMMPPAAQFAEAMSRHGVGDDSRVVLYDAGMGTWAARVWWMLRAFGFEQAAVLNGGWKKWTLEDRPTESGASPAVPRATFTAREGSSLFVEWQEVLAVLNKPDVCLVNALSADEHAGKVTRVARPGRIPGSLNVPASTLVDPATHAFRDPHSLEQMFRDVLRPNHQRVITYCGGGIAACADAFVLTLLGAGNVAVYDGSLVEWSARPELPLETDTQTS